MRLTLLAGVALAVAACAATPADATDLGFDLTTTPTLVLPSVGGGVRTRLHLEVPTLDTGSGEAYCSWSLTGAAQPAVPASAAGGLPVAAIPARPILSPAVSGSFLVEPAHSIDYAPGSIPGASDLWCVGYPRGGQTTVPLTVDVVQSGL